MVNKSVGYSQYQIRLSTTSHYIQTTAYINNSSNVLWNILSDKKRLLWVLIIFFSRSSHYGFRIINLLNILQTLD